MAKTPEIDHPGAIRGVGLGPEPVAVRRTGVVVKRRRAAGLTARDRQRGFAALVNRVADMQVGSRRMRGAGFFFAVSWLVNTEGAGSVDIRIGSLVFWYDLAAQDSGTRSLDIGRSFPVKRVRCATSRTRRGFWTGR